jgi:hypothetical protein
MQTHRFYLPMPSKSSNSPPVACTSHPLSIRKECQSSSSSTIPLYFGRVQCLVPALSSDLDPVTATLSKSPAMNSYACDANFERLASTKMFAGLRSQCTSFKSCMRVIPAATDPKAVFNIDECPFLDQFVGIAIVPLENELYDTFSIERH